MSALANLRRFRGRLRDIGPNGYCGRYSDWASAAAASDGYDSPVILETTRRATALVRDGTAAFQQDGMTTAELPDHARRIALVLAIAALEREGRLSVLDFGGALGGAFFAYRRLFDAAVRFTWRVVEPTSYCDLGRREFATPHLSFFEQIEDAVAAERPDVVLCVSSLQFLRQIDVALRTLAGLGARYLVVDRTPFAVGGDAEIVVQRVPRALYPASYPSWLLCESAFLSAVAPAYDVWLRWDIPSAFTARARFKGFALRAKAQA